MQSLDDLDELFFQRVYERHYGLPWCIGETERLKIREALQEEDVEKLLELFSDAEAVRWLFDEEKESYLPGRAAGKARSLSPEPLCLFRNMVSIPSF